MERPRNRWDDAALNDALSGWASIFKWAALLVGGGTVLLIAALALYYA